MEFLKSRGATMVRHASKSVNQHISLKTKEASFFAKSLAGARTSQGELFAAIFFSFVAVEKFPAVNF